MSLPEVLLWKELRKLDRVKFRRQHPIGPFVLDFYCDKARLAVEIDGAEHSRESNAAYDKRRDAWLRDQGLMVLRIPARDVLRDVGSVVEELLETVARRQG